MEIWIKKNHRVLGWNLIWVLGFLIFQYYAKPTWSKEEIYNGTKIIEAMNKNNELVVIENSSTSFPPISDLVQKHYEIFNLSQQVNDEVLVKSHSQDFKKVWRDNFQKSQWLFYLPRVQVFRGV